LAVDTEHGTDFRPYTLSDTTRHATLYRISVKQEYGEGENGPVPGRVSSYLHEKLRVGDTLYAKGPAGKFGVLTNDNRPLSLISVGIGITPFGAMLNPVRKDNPGRQVHFFHGIRSQEHFALQKDIEACLKVMPNLKVSVFISGETLPELPSMSVHAGRVNTKSVLSAIDVENTHVLLCGTPSFTKDMYEGLLRAGVSETHIDYEYFGAPEADENTDHSQYEVTFLKSAKKVTYSSREGSLLDMAERHNIPIASGCRFGACQACEATLVSGDVDYADGVEEPTGKKKVLLCSARPQSNLVIDL